MAVGAVGRWASSWLRMVSSEIFASSATASISLSCSTKVPHSAVYNAVLGEALMAWDRETSALV